jgi:hypothetical protein
MPAKGNITSVFQKWESQAYPFVYRGELVVATIAGGTPSDSEVAEAWLRSKLTADKDELIREAVAKTMVERGITMDEAAEVVSSLRHLNGFKRDEDGLYIDGRQLKACLKEAVSIAANEGKITTKGWGNPDNANYKKGIKSWFPEHVFVIEDRLGLGVTEPTGIMQRFVHAPHGTGIQYEEFVENAHIEFTVESDHEFPDEQWAAIWLTAERQGVGASRSQGFGRFTVTKWDRVI